MSGLSRTERNKREVRGRIVAAARELFDQRGIEATKVESICDQADIALRTFFNHFPSKRDVVFQLAVDATAELAARISGAHAQGRSTRERLALFFAESIEVALLAGPTHREVLAALLVVPVGSRDQQAARDAMIALLNEGVTAGDVVAAHPVETLADVVLGSFYRIIADWANREDDAVRERLENVSGFLCDAIAPA